MVLTGKHKDSGSSRKGAQEEPKSGNIFPRGIRDIIGRVKCVTRIDRREGGRGGRLQRGEGGGEGDNGVVSIGIARNDGIDHAISKDRQQDPERATATE